MEEERYYTKTLYLYVNGCMKDEGRKTIDDGMSGGDEWGWVDIPWQYEQYHSVMFLLISFHKSLQIFIVKFCSFDIAKEGEEDKGQYK